MHRPRNRLARRYGIWVVLTTAVLSFTFLPIIAISLCYKLGIDFWLGAFISIAASIGLFIFLSWLLLSPYQGRAAR